MLRYLYNDGIMRSGPLEIGYIQAARFVRFNEIIPVRELLSNANIMASTFQRLICVPALVGSRYVVEVRNCVSTYNLSSYIATVNSSAYAVDN